MEPIGVMEDSLRIALALLQIGRPAELRQGLLGSSRKELLAKASDVASRDDAIGANAAELAARDFGAVVILDEEYPQSLLALEDGPPVMFYWGAEDLWRIPAIGMCGSRNASAEGLLAARMCGEEVASHGLVVVSGYAKGVDTQTHLSALRSRGRTIIVLAEGISHFRVKRSLAEFDAIAERILALSQFPPFQTWNVGAAMTRNAVIAGLGRALVVVEAAETGGTLDAGIRALELGKPVLALEFESQATPRGNQILIERGAIPIRSRPHLGRVLDHLAAVPAEEPVRANQLSLL